VYIYVFFRFQGFLYAYVFAPAVCYFSYEYTCTSLKVIHKTKVRNVFPFTGLNVNHMENISEKVVCYE
jgi:hypothetical protein